MVIIMQMIYLMNKKFLCFFLVLSALCTFSVRCWALEHMGYFKYKNTAVVSVENAEFTSAVFVVAEYAEGRLVSLKQSTVQAKNNS